MRRIISITLYLLSIQFVLAQSNLFPSLGGQRAGAVSEHDAHRGGGLR